MNSFAFMKLYIKKQSPEVQAVVAEYLKYATENGARLCNDGYPDTRFKATYLTRHNKVRRYIDKLRVEYDIQYPRVKQFCTAECKAKRNG